MNALGNDKNKLAEEEEIKFNRTGREDAHSATGHTANKRDDVDTGNSGVDRNEELTQLVPLVKVAWAEGRITRRERELICRAAEMRGIHAGTPAFERLSSWLDLHPTDEFYESSLELLSVAWSELPEDERFLRLLDLISDCINIAEASGGSATFAAGGRRVCDEEFAAVKRIADRLKPAAPAPIL